MRPLTPLDNVLARYVEKAAVSVSDIARRKNATSAELAELLGMLGIIAPQGAAKAVEALGGLPEPVEPPAPNEAPFPAIPVLPGQPDEAYPLCGKQLHHQSPGNKRPEGGCKPCKNEAAQRRREDARRNAS